MKYTVNTLYLAIRDIMERADDIPYEEDALTILSITLDHSAEELELLCNARVPRVYASRAIKFARRRARGEPMAYLTGRFEFLGLEFLINKNAIVPSRDTEILIKNALAMNLSGRVLDVGAGCGAIGISLAHYNKDITATLLDISRPALQLARRNIKKNGLKLRVNCKTEDIFKSDLSVYDAIIGNPPYLSTNKIADMRKEVSYFAPNVALDGGSDGLDFHRYIAKNARGHVFLEFGIGQDSAIESIFREYDDIRFASDSMGFRRFIGARAKQTPPQL